MFNSPNISKVQPTLKLPRHFNPEDVCFDSSDSSSGEETNNHNIPDNGAITTNDVSDKESILSNADPLSPASPRLRSPAVRDTRMPRSRFDSTMPDGDEGLPSVAPSAAAASLGGIRRRFNPSDPPTIPHRALNLNTPASSQPIPTSRTNTSFTTTETAFGTATPLRTAPRSTSMRPNPPQYRDLETKFDEEDAAAKAGNADQAQARARQRGETPGPEDLRGDLDRVKEYLRRQRAREREREEDVQAEAQLRVEGEVAAGSGEQEGDSEMGGLMKIVLWVLFIFVMLLLNVGPTNLVRMVGMWYGKVAKGFDEGFHQGFGNGGDGEGGDDMLGWP